MVNRQNVLNNWLKKFYENEAFSLELMHGDASFRKYYRLFSGSTTRIIMDAPPDKESLSTFIAVATILRNNQIRIPTLYAADESLGFAILEDLGNTLLLDCVNAHIIDKYYRALELLHTLQSTPTINLPEFNVEFMHQELALFNTWFLKGYLHRTLQPQEKALIQHAFHYVTQNIINQPSVFIHRDFHSRNIMILPENEALALIDFQDAMRGPFTYDLVSLLKDCYIQWPRDQLKEWLHYFYGLNTIAQSVSFSEFVDAFDLCGIQRHLKVLGIFCRLSLRDQKPQYLKYLPLTLEYILTTLETQPPLNNFYQFMKELVLP